MSSVETATMDLVVIRMAHWTGQKALVFGSHGDAVTRTISVKFQLYGSLLRVSVLEFVWVIFSALIIIFYMEVSVFFGIMSELSKLGTPSSFPLKFSK